MPTYPYACTECEHTFEVVQSFSDEALSDCPECRGSLRKLYSSVGIVFKGSGFYRTDSRADTKSAATTPSASSSTPSTAPTTTESTSTSPAPTPAATSVS